MKERRGLLIQQPCSPIAKCLAWLVLALCLSACSDDNTGQQGAAKETIIGYNFRYQDSLRDPAQGLPDPLKWIERLTDSSEVWVWQAEAPTWLDSLCPALPALKGAKLTLAFGKEDAEIPNCLRSLEPGQFEAHFRQTASGLPANLVIATQLQPNGQDNGRFFLSFSNFDLSKAPSAMSEILEIYGDSSLFQRYREHFQAAFLGSNSGAVEQSHTYSNTHDHLAWFFPSDVQVKPLEEILEHLEQGIISKRYPARVRLAVSEWDACESAIARQLASMQAIHELDLKILVPDSQSISAAAAIRLMDLPKGSFRVYTPDSLKLLHFSSNLLLIHGPYVMAKGALAERQSLTFLLPGGIRGKDLHNSFGSWIRIADKDVFKKAELHFEQMWQMASDSITGPKQWNTSAKNCRD